MRFCIECGEVTRSLDGHGRSPWCRRCAPTVRTQLPEEDDDEWEVRMHWLDDLEAWARDPRTW